MSEILPGVVEEAERLLDVASRDGTTMSLLGGVAVRLRAPEVPPVLDREYKDIDFAIPKGRAAAAELLLRGAGYESEVMFNAMNSKERMLFHDTENGRQVDVFVGSFRMCHEIPFGDRLRPGERTVPLAELLLTKLQIIELNEKDVRDTVLLFHGHDIGESDEADAVNAARIAQLCAADWGLWRTITQNLDRCRQLLGDYELPASDRQRVGDRLAAVVGRIEEEPKTRGWRLRAKIGERKRWYELPEEVEQ